jgi:hypothetical protein
VKTNSISRIFRIRAFGARLVVCAFITGSAWMANAAGPACSTDSFTNSLGDWVFINSAPCGTYGEVYSRWQTNNNVATLVKMKYMVNEPAGPAKAIVLLFTGGSGDAGIVPGTNGTVANAATNFLVRSAQLFVDDGYRTVVVDSPEDSSGNKLYTNGLINANAAFDLYRVSVTNAWDIENVIQQIPGWTNLQVFLAGTSRGALTTVAQYHLGMGICLSSAVNVGNNTPGYPLYIGELSEPALQPTNVTVPVQFLVNADDACPEASPSITTNTLWKEFTNDTVLGGALNLAPSVVVSSNADGTDACGDVEPHGYLGIEINAVGTITSWLDQVLPRLKVKNVIALDSSLILTNMNPVTVDLSPLISVPPAPSFSLSLPYATSVSGVAISLAGTKVNYTPNSSGADDGFLFQYTDTNGVRSIGMVRLRFGENPQLAIQSASPIAVILSWPGQSAGWFLQETPSMSPTAWLFSTSGPTNPATVPMSSAAENFYRLFKP